MGMILVRQRSVEEVRKVLAFFEANPKRKDCIVGLGSDTHCVKYMRGEIPKLQDFVDEAWKKVLHPAFAKEKPEARAKAYQELMKDGGYTIEEIAAKVNKKPFVIRRLVEKYKG